MYVWSSRIIQQSRDQPGTKVANSASGQLNREENDCSLSSFAPENLFSRDGFGHPVPREPAYSPRSVGLNLELTQGIPSHFRSALLFTGWLFI